MKSTFTYINIAACIFFSACAEEPSENEYNSDEKNKDFENFKNALKSLASDKLGENGYDVNALETIAQEKWDNKESFAHLTDEELAKIKKKSDNGNPVSQSLQKGQMKIGNEICDFNSLASFLKSVKKIKKGKPSNVNFNYEWSKEGISFAGGTPFNFLKDKNDIDSFFKGCRVLKENSEYWKPLRIEGNNATRLNLGGGSQTAGPEINVNDLKFWKKVKEYHDLFGEKIPISIENAHEHIIFKPFKSNGKVYGVKSNLPWTTFLYLSESHVCVNDKWKDVFEYKALSLFFPFAFSDKTLLNFLCPSCI